MDPEDKQLLKESLDISKQNNVMLTKLIRIQKWNTIYRVAYWAVIIFSSVGLLYFLKPLLGNALNVYTGGLSGTSTFDTNQKQMQDLINSLK